MPTPEERILSLTILQDRLSRRSDDLKRLIVSVQSLSQPPSTATAFLLQEVRAAAIVGIVAELEALTRSTIDQIHRYINAASVPLKTLSACLRQLAAHDAFESLRTLQDASKVWERRAYATSLDRQLLDATLPLPTKGPLPPMDGRTPNPILYSRIWAVYGLPGDAFPAASWSASLQKLSGLRNDIAHGNIPFSEVFQQPGVTAKEIERYIDDVDAFSIHFILAVVDYLENERFRSPTLANVTQTLSPSNN